MQISMHCFTGSVEAIEPDDKAFVKMESLSEIN